MSERFGPYELVRLLGRGGMGEVHAALDTEQDRPVALKRLLSHLADDEEFQKRFRRESRTAARLASPHVIPIHRSGEIDGQLFIDMRLVEGLDLDQLLARDAHLAPARVVAVIEQVASALDAAHHAGLIHRDVKPSNVLLDTAVGANDFVYLVDFGITRPFGEESQALTSTHAVVGSLDYMAPEQFDGVADPSIDIYSLGCLLYQTLTGSRPFPLEGFPALMRAHLSLPAPAPSVHRPALGTAFDEVVAVALAKDPRDRYASAGALAAAARTALETATAAGTDRWTDPTPRPAGPTERAPTPRRPVPSRSGPPTGPPPRALSPAHDPATSLVRAAPEPVTGMMAPQHAPDPVTTAMPPRSAPPRPPTPPPGAPHPSFPYAAPPWPIEDEAVPEAYPEHAWEQYPEHAWEQYPEEDEAPPARSSVQRRLVLAVLLVVLLAVGVLAGRVVAAWATGGSPLGSLLGAGLELVASVPASPGV